jgi:hypothetical protein
MTSLSEVSMVGTPLLLLSLCVADDKPAPKFPLGKEGMVAD